MDRSDTNCLFRADTFFNRNLSDLCIACDSCLQKVVSFSLVFATLGLFKGCYIYISCT